MCQHTLLFHSAGFLHNVLAQVSYNLRNDTSCDDDLGFGYSTKDEAERICDQMQLKHNNCTTVYDNECDGVDYRICREGAAIRESTNGSCTYSRSIYCSTNAIHCCEIIRALFC